MTLTEENDKLKAEVDRLSKVGVSILEIAALRAEVERMLHFIRRCGLEPDYRDMVALETGDGEVTLDGERYLKAKAILKERRP